MECPSLLDVLGFLKLPDENIDLVTNQSKGSEGSETMDTQNLTNKLEIKQDEYNNLKESTNASDNIISGGSAQGDSTQIKVIELGSKRFFFKNNYAPKRKSAKRTKN